MKVADEVKRLIRIQLGVEEVGENNRFLEDFGAESADLLNLVLAVEEKFNIELREDKLDSVNTVGDMVTLIENHIGGTL